MQNNDSIDIACGTFGHLQVDKGMCITLAADAKVVLTNSSSKELVLYAQLTSNRQRHLLQMSHSPVYEPTALFAKTSNRKKAKALSRGLSMI